MQALTRRSLFLISSRIFSISNVLIVHLSSHSSNNPHQPSNYPFRRHEDDARNVRVSVWWDFENIHLPAAVSPYQVAHRITSALRANGIKGPVQISAYGNVSILTRSIQEALFSTGISLIHVPAGGKNGADRLLIIDMLYWVSQHPPPAHLFLISGDRDFAGILHRLRMSNYNILVANAGYVSTPLCSAASVVWQWNTLMKGENLAGRRFNQPPDGLAGSWYGNCRLPLESLFPSVEQPAASLIDGSSESETENALRPIPANVVNKVRQILSSHPKGVSITTLRQDLNNEMIIDDDLYGYRKFSLFLSAMPEILAMRPLGDGQYSVCAINSEAPESPSPGSSMNPSERSVVDDNDRNIPMTVVEVCDGSSSTKPEDKKPASDSPIGSDKKPQSSQLPISFDMHTVQHPSPAIHVKKLSQEGQGPTKNDKDTLESCNDHLAVIKKQNVSKEDSYFRRTWKRLFGGNDDCAMSNSQEENIVKQTPTTFRSPMNSEAYDEGRKQSGFFIRIINTLKLDGYVTGKVSEASNSVYQAYDTFSEDSYWAEIKSFLGTPQGADIISKSKSRLQIAQTMKNEGPAVFHSIKDSDLLHVVDLLIDDKRWVEERPSQSSPFKVISKSEKPLSENPNKSNATSSRLIGKQQHSDFQKLPKHDGEKNQRPPCGIYVPDDNKRSLEKTRTRMLGDCRKLLSEVIKEHPHGYPLKGFRKLFAERYCYNLNLEALGFETLASLVKKIPGLTVEGPFIYPGVANSGSSMADIRSDITRKIGHSGRDRERCDTSRNYETLDSQFDELGPAMDLKTTGRLKSKTSYSSTSA